MNKNLKKKNIQNLEFLPNKLNSILIGIMLGDGSISRTSNTSNCRFEMSFGFKYKDFAESIGALFKEFIKTPVKTIEIKSKCKTKTYTNFRLKTVSLPVFNYYFDMFYIFNIEKNKYVKIIPLNISELLDPVVLAYFIMTDGNFDKSRNRVRIYTNSYKLADVVKLALAINERLGIYAGVLHDRKNQ